MKYKKVVMLEYGFSISLLLCTNFFLNIYLLNIVYKLWQHSGVEENAVNIVSPQENLEFPWKA